MCSSTECLLLGYWGGDKPLGWASSPTDHVTWSLILLSSVWEEKSCEWKAVEFWPFPGSTLSSHLGLYPAPPDTKAAATAGQCFVLDAYFQKLRGTSCV